jgi:hypothetical protein
MTNCKRTKSQGFNATALQIRRAYESHFGTKLEGSYSEAAETFVKLMGMEKAHEFILSQSNDPNDSTGFIA